MSQFRSLADLRVYEKGFIHGPSGVVTTLHKIGLRVPCPEFTV